MMARIVLDRLTFPCAAKYPAFVPCATQTPPTPRLVSLRSWHRLPHHRQPLMLQTQVTPPRATTRGRGQATQCRLCRRGRVLQQRSHAAASWQRVGSSRYLRPPWQHVVVLCRRKAWRRRHLWACRVLRAHRAIVCIHAYLRARASAFLRVENGDMCVCAIDVSGSILSSCHAVECAWR
jgi:hypothetical protein